MDALFSFFDVAFRFPERFLWLIPVFAVLIALFVRKIKKTQTVCSDPWLSMHLSFARIPGWKHMLAPWMFFAAACALLIGVYAEPERRVIVKEPIYGDVRATFLFDASRSMRHAYDVAPNRLLAAKEVVKKFTALLWKDPELTGHYSLALVPFAEGVISMYLPFTTSRSEFVWALENINERTVTNQGTSLATALFGYSELLSKRPPASQNTVDLAFLISDGGKGEGVKEEIPLREIVQRKLPSNVFIVTVGIGKVTIVHRGEGLPPLRKTEPVSLIVKDDDGNFVDYLREKESDPQSSILTSELDEDSLRRLAHTEDDYYLFTDEKVLMDAFKQSILKYRKHVSDTERVHYEPVLAWFLVPAFVLLYCALGLYKWFFVAIAYIGTVLLSFKKLFIN